MNNIPLHAYTTFAKKKKNLRRLRQKVLQFDASLGYKVKLCIKNKTKQNILWVVFPLSHWSLEA
jgi:hypothetical protein